MFQLPSKLLLTRRTLPFRIQKKKWASVAVDLLIKTREARKGKKMAEETPNNIYILYERACQFSQKQSRRTTERTDDNADPIDWMTACNGMACMGLLPSLGLSESSATVSQREKNKGEKKKTIAMLPSSSLVSPPPSIYHRARLEECSAHAFFSRPF